MEKIGNCLNAGGKSISETLTNMRVLTSYIRAQSRKRTSSSNVVAVALGQIVIEVGHQWIGVPSTPIRHSLTTSLYRSAKRFRYEPAF